MAKMLWQGGGRPRSRAVAALVTVFLVCGALTPALAAAVTVNVRIEGEHATLWRGPVSAGASLITDIDGVDHVLTNKAICTVAEAAQLSGFPYKVKDFGFALMVQSIAGEDGVGMIGWNYRVNGVSPNVGSDSYALKGGENVLWYYGTYDASPTVAQVSTRALAVNTTLTVTAKQLDMGGHAYILPDATVHVGSAVATSNASGLVQIKLSRLGRYGVRVEKAGYVRSEVQYVKVAYPSAITGFATSKKLVRYGSWVALTGRLVSMGSGLGGRRIVIQQRPVGTIAWRSVAAVVTRRAGGFYKSLRPGRSVWYRAVWSGDASHLGAKSAQRRVLVWR